MLRKILEKFILDDIKNRHSTQLCQIAYLSMILIFLYVPLVVLKFFTSGCLYAIAVPAFFLVVGGLIIFTLLILVKRDKIIEEILKNKHDEIIRNKKNIEIGKDLLAPLGGGWLE